MGIDLLNISIPEWAYARLPKVDWVIEFRNVIGCDCGWRSGDFLTQREALLMTEWHMRTEHLESALEGGGGSGDTGDSN